MSHGIDFKDPTPLYEQIERDITEKIRSGSLKPGDNIGSQSELSQGYSVSAITVKKALSNLVASGALFTRVGKGTYVAAPKAAPVDFSKHRTIGLVLRDMKHPFFSMIVQGIEERAYERGYNLLLSSSSNKIEKEEKQIERFRKMGVDGLIIASLSLEYRATPYIQRLHDENFPYIMVSYIHDPHCWYVGSDQELGGYLATEHLIKLGRRSIAYLHAGKGNLLSEIRKNGYYRALTEYNIPFDSRLILSDDTSTGTDRYKLGYKIGRSFFSLPQKPDAIFFYSDLAALGFAQAAYELKIRIPEDVALVGFDDIMYAGIANIRLTTIHQPAETIGRTAVDIIEKRLNGEDIGNRTILKPALIVRESSGAKLRSQPRPRPRS